MNRLWGLVCLFAIGCSDERYALSLSLVSGQTTIEEDQLAALMIRASPEHLDGSHDELLCARVTTAQGTLDGSRAPLAVDGGVSSCEAPRCVQVKLSREELPTAFVVYRAGAAGDDVLVGDLMLSFLCDADTDTEIAASTSLTLTVVQTIDAGVDG
jgi:hypothetical protein